MLEEQKQEANKKLSELYDYLQSLFNTDIDGVNDLIQKQVIQISGGFVRRLYYLQNNVELHENDYSAFLDGSDIDIFLINTTNDIDKSYFFIINNEKTENEKCNSFEVTTSEINKISKVNEYLSYPTELDVSLCDTIKNIQHPNNPNYIEDITNTSISVVNLKVTDNLNQSYPSKDVEKKTYLYSKKHLKDFDGDNHNLPNILRYYNPLVSFEIINENFVLFNRKHLFKVYNSNNLKNFSSKSPLSRFKILNNCDNDNINIQIIKSLTLSKLKRNVIEKLEEINHINKQTRAIDNNIVQHYTLDNYDNSYELFTKVFDLKCCRYTITTLGKNLDQTKIQNNDNANFYEIEFDDEMPLFKNIDRRIIKYLDYGFKLSDKSYHRLMNCKKEHEKHNFSRKIFSSYY
ncbi:hypothetical protein PBI_SCTP2_149 [Salicola phage SCTP-2]|nr:hypothetical protein PBI_SCTP2_149 [Salicola phage SCTP-2]